MMDITVISVTTDTKDGNMHFTNNTFSSTKTKLLLKIEILV